MIGDLLEGAGANLVGIEPVVNEGEVAVPEKNPLDHRRECLPGLSLRWPRQGRGSGPDGLDGDWVPGYYVFIDTGAGLVLCDATATRRSGAFAEIGDPLASAIRSAKATSRLRAWAQGL